MKLFTEELLQRNAFDFSVQDKERNGIFQQSLKEELCFHYEQNEKYRRFCNNKGFNPYDYDGNVASIPPVQVSVFKELGRELSSVPKEEIKLTLQSSATSGVPSSIPVDKVTSKRQAKAMVRVVGEAIGNERKPFLVMDVNPAEGFRELLGARFAAVSGYLNFASKTGYFLKVNENQQYYFDIEGIKNFISELNEDEPTVVFGFTYILFSEVIRPLSEQGIKFKLPKGSKIIHIGGWKKLESEKIDKKEFNRKAADIFGIDQVDVIDIYGFTEQMGLNYPDCPCGCKHTSLYSDVIVRDVTTKEICKPGQEGMLEFVTPIPHSYPGNAVLTDDIGVIEEGECPYGRPGTRFRIIGRLKKAEVRGCGDILSSKLKFARKDNSVNHNDKSKYEVLYFAEQDRIYDMPPKQSLKEIESYLRKQLEWLREQPVDALIGLVARAAKKWDVNNTDNEKLQELKMNGLSFLGAWCTVEHLNSIVTEGLNGNRMHIDSFIPTSNDGIQYRKAVSKGLMCHWLAGNVQVLGMFVLIESILTKNVNLLKVSSRDEGVFRTLLSAFEGEVFVTKGGYKICGDDLLKTVALVYYDHSDAKLGEEMSQMADVRVAWGGREAVMTVSSYPAKFDCEDLIMGPKLSFSVISAEALANDHNVKKLARKVAVDASVFDQTGCASVHNVFVEKNGAVSPKQFAEHLAEGMKKVAKQIPKGNISAEQVSAIHSARGIYDFKGIVYGDKDSVWTVLYSDDDELNSPVYSRVVFVHPVDSVFDVIKYVNENIQTIGLAAEGEKAFKFAERAADAGAMRFPACGRMLNFDSPWDGMYLTDRMVRWVTLGGPSV